MFFYLSKYFTGHAVSTLTSRHVGKMDDLKEINQSLPNFEYHLNKKIKLPNILRIIHYNLFYLRKGLQLHRQKKFDAIVVNSPYLPGIVGWILKLITGAKLIIEIQTHPTKFYSESEKELKITTKFFLAAAKIIAPFVLNRADVIKTLHPGQLQDLTKLKPISEYTFPDFVPINIVNQSANQSFDEKYVLLLGTPWYLKGVDILIQSWNQIHKQFPEYQLRIVGKCDDKSYFEKLSKGNKSIKLMDPVPNKIAHDLIAKCSVYVNASRTEGVPRVLMESMSIGKPIIATNVGGNSTLIKHQETGILIQPNNITELSNALSLLLNQPNISKQYGENAKRHIFKISSEETFATNYYNLVESLF